MKVLHITNEFTKKNFSISSLILFITDYLTKNHQIISSILTSQRDKLLFKEDKIECLVFYRWIDFFFKKN